MEPEIQLNPRAEHTTEKPIQTIEIPFIDATEENIAAYGMLIGGDVVKPGLGIPFYTGRVLEGKNIDFEYKDEAVIRTAKIMPGYPLIHWLERHMDMTQLFIGLGSEPFVMALAPPCANPEDKTPDITKAKAFKFPPGHCLLLHKGTWHDFPIACEKPVVVLTANSAEVVEALVAMKSPGEMDQGDVFKINLEKRLGVHLKIEGT